MTTIDRRDLGLGLGGLGLGVGLGAATAITGTVGFAAFAIAQARPRVVIIGGGPGGATVANRLMRANANLDVTLIEADKVYTTCFFSNLYIGGFRTYDSLRHGYEGLRRLGVRVVHERADAIDTAARVVKTASGGVHAYDRLVVAPGIDIKYDSIEGYSPEVSKRMPHAYIPGAQTRILKRQLDAMRDGGTVVMVMPNNPYRCPPGPYERACMIAHLIKTRKPKSKLVILDPKRAFSKQEVFMEAFKRYYDGIIDLNLTNEIDDFAVSGIDVGSMTFTTKAGTTVKADVANVIPSQRAGDIAIKSGLASGEWCAVDAETFASKAVKDVYVLGDAATAAEMPKSAYSANNQANAVAADILAVLAKREKYSPNFRNTCWSMLAPDDSVKIGAGYVVKGGKLDPVGAFISKPGEDAATRKANFAESVAWYSAVVEDAFANSTPASPGREKKAKRA